MLFFFLFLLCSLVFATDASANVLIEGDSTSLESSIGDTVPLVARTRINYGENLVKWELVSGQGKIVDATVDSTGFIPSTDSATIRMVTQTLPFYELTEERTKYRFDKNSVRVPRARSWGGDYGIRFYLDTHEGTQYAQITESGQSIGFLYMGTDSTFKTTLTRICINHRCFFNTEPNTRVYTYVYASASGTSSPYMKDSVFVRISKTYTISASSSGRGAAYVDSALAGGASVGVQSYSRVINTDTSRIFAVPGNDHVFDHWEVVSGSCAILDSTMDTTGVINVKSDCNVRAVFRAGVIYPVSGTPTQYNFDDHIFARKASSGSAGVRFLFVAPNTGTYAVVVSNEITQDSAVYIRYTDTDYKTEAVKERFLGTHVDSMTLAAGDEVAIVIANTGNSANPFYISNSTQANSLRLVSGPYGKALPAGGYDPAYAGARYSIAGESIAEGFRFSNWQIVAGDVMIDDAKAPYTYVIIGDNVELRANFKGSSVYKLSGNKQSFNFQDNYYSESTRSAIRFSWNPPDTGSYVVTFEPVDPLHGIFKEYGSDTTFATELSEKAVSGTTSFIVRGTPGTKLYFTVQDSGRGMPNKSFRAWISSPYVLKVVSDKEGAAYPSGNIYTTPGDKTILTAWPHGGYKFKSWESTEGDIDIESPKESRTTVTLKDSACTIKATFSIDEQAEPLISINKLNMSNFPEICAQVSVTDKNSGNSFYGLTSDDFTLTQDSVSIKPQAIDIKSVSGVSVVIVVDQSNSMKANNRMGKAKDAIRAFVNDMGPYDRTAIVGFVGNVYIKDTSLTAAETDSIRIDSTIVHQAMTSDKAQLLQAIDSIKAIGGSTNILTGTYTGIQQITDESNATAVIVFSDGENNAGTTNLVDVINQAKNIKTPIYTIGVETDSKYPLEDLAKNTGGTFSFASDASELTGLYAGIRDDVMSQYIVCYQTPDTTQNGKKHNVFISTKFNQIQTTDSIQWDNRSIPPAISLTDSTWKLIAKSQPENKSFKIGVRIKTKVGVTFASIYLRTSGNDGFYTRYQLKNVRDSLWEFTVPANIIVAPGLDFYVTASDSAGQSGHSPKVQVPGKEPYTIFIGNDIPDIKALSVACEDSTSSIKTFSFRITDSDGIDKAKLFYKDSKARYFQEVDLTHSDVNDSWNFKFDANSDKFSSILYYIRVTDGKNVTVRYKNDGNLTTEACEIKTVIPPEPDDSLETDTIPVVPKDTSGFTRRDSIKYSLVADTAEIYDKNLDGKADFVRIHFKEEKDDNVSQIDSIFWNSNRGEWRYASSESIKKNKSDGKWIEAYINKPYKYGLTKADTTRKPFLSFTSVHSDKMENVKLRDKIGAVPLKAFKHHGTIDLEQYMSPSSEPPPDTLIVIMSEPIKNTGNDEAWKKLFRYSSSCTDSITHSLHIRGTPNISENGVQWNIILDDFTLKAGFCLRTNPKAKYKDMEGNKLGQGGVPIAGANGANYLSKVKPIHSISSKKRQDWLPPKSSIWEPLPDTVSAISVKTWAPYTAEVYIFDAIANYVTHFEQKFGYDGEMDDPKRNVSKDQSKLGYLYWDQRTKDGRKVGTGVYIWKILFTFDDGYKETVFVKAGLKRNTPKKK